MEPVDPVELREGDLVLRPWRRGDVDSVFAECQDDEIQRWTRVPSPYTRQDAEEFVGASSERWGAGHPSFAAVDAGSGKLVGSIGVVDGSKESGVDIGFRIAASARGRGIGTRATQLMAGWLFDLGHPRITWHAEVGNIASRKLAESAGFVIEGVARQGLVLRGRRVDAWMGSLLPADLQRAREAGAASPKNHLSGWPVTPVELRSERLLLRTSRESDAPALLQYANDPVASIWDPEETTDLDAAKERARRRADWSAGDIAVWVIADPDDTQIYSGIQMFDVAKKSLHATVGYGLMADARGHGYAAEALKLVADWAFTTTSLQRLMLMHAVENQASCAVALSAGFAIEGTTRQSYRFGDGELHDEHLHARLRDDPDD